MFFPTELESKKKNELVAPNDTDSDWNVDTYKFFLCVSA